jgi:hypothetical protein
LLSDIAKINRHEFAPRAIIPHVNLIPVNTNLGQLLNKLCVGVLAPIIATDILTEDKFFGDGNSSFSASPGFAVRLDPF